MEENISMQELKEQRLTPAEKFVLDKVKGAKAGKPNENGDVSWYDKDGRWLFEQDFKSGRLWVENLSFYSVLRREYSLKNDEIDELLTKLLHKYTNNGQLKVV